MAFPDAGVELLFYQDDIFETAMGRRSEGEQGEGTLAMSAKKLRDQSPVVAQSG